MLFFMTRTRRGLAKTVDLGPASRASKERQKEVRWGFVRLALGMIQVMGAPATALLLMQSGVNSLSLSVLVITGLFTVLSRVSFWRRWQPRELLEIDYQEKHKEPPGTRGFSGRPFNQLLTIRRKWLRTDRLAPGVDLRLDCIADGSHLFQSGGVAALKSGRVLKRLGEPLCRAGKNRAGARCCLHFAANRDHVREHRAGAPGIEHGLSFVCRDVCPDLGHRVDRQ